MAKASTAKKSSTKKETTKKTATPKTTAKKAPAKKTTAIKTKSKSVNLSDETIAAKAYEIWETEGRPDGRADEHWAKAVEALSE